jgi:hypothetical protein
MTRKQMLDCQREVDRFIRAGDIASAEQIAVELSPILEPLYDEIDNRGIVLSWECDH